MRRLRVLSIPAIAAVVVALAFVLAGTGSSEQGLATGAAAIVPGDALAYMHLSIDARRPAVKRALGLTARFPDYPLLSAAVTTRLGAIAAGAASVDFATDIRPWLGKEAALALLNTTTSTAGSLIVLDVSRRALARAFVSRSGAVASASYRGTQLFQYPRTGTEVAFVSHYLAIGQDASVRAAIDVASGHAGSLASAAAYRSAAAGEPADRVFDAYASAAGVRRLLAPQSGVVGAFGALLYQPALAGATLSVSAVSGGARVRVHSALDPKLARLSGPRPKAFSPSLAHDVPSGSMLMLDVTHLDKVAPRVLNAGRTGGIVGRLGPLLSRLGVALQSEGVNVHDLENLFSGESAVAIAPHAHAPALIIVTRTRDEAQTKTELAAAEVPLAQLFPAPIAGPGQAPEFNDRQVAGVTAHQLALAPGLEIDYAVFDGLVVLSTSLDGIASIAAHAHSLVSEPQYRSALADHPQQVTSLLFLDFSQLLSLGEQTGLTRSGRFRALRPDLDRIRAIGLSSTSGEADTTAELFLQIP